MELKPYQQQVLEDLCRYLDFVQETKDPREAFIHFWTFHPRTPLKPFPGQAIEPYKNNIPGVPHLCVKVPTAGGKTFIACNALKTLFEAFDSRKSKVVVWLVPSITILEQTLRNLKDPSHPYRQRINAHFGHKVEVFDKNALLQGSGFNATTVEEQLNIMVFSFDSLRAKNKEDRKVFQENGNLQSFEHILGRHAEITLGEVIKHLNPVVIVDESHNAETELSVDMLKGLNPCFILDLTATPRRNSNIISFVDALELKREHMVKLPVIVYNHQDRTGVISSALQLQKHLEHHAMEEEKQGGRYIRPIVLFQAQPKNSPNYANEEEEKSNVQKLKEKLLELGIPDTQIKIKTAFINEIKNVDLLSRECDVRYIITINALKDGWDCPFAYILASLADKSSAVDVEQILGRVLRQPYVMSHRFQLLNMSYVLTSSTRFKDTLQNIVKGLNKAGFSDKDYKLADPLQVEVPILPGPSKQLIIDETPETGEDLLGDIDVTKIIGTENDAPQESTIQEIEKTAIEQSEALRQMAETYSDPGKVIMPTEIQTMVKSYEIKEIFRELASGISLPQFFHGSATNDIFGSGELLLENESLLKNFPLSKSDSDIDFSSVSSELYKVDLDESRKEHTPTFVRIDNLAQDQIIPYLLDPSRKDSRIKNFTRRIIKNMGSMYPIPDRELEKYINRVLEYFTDAQFTNLAHNEYTYSDKIKQKIKSLSYDYAEKQFRIGLDTDKIWQKPSYRFPETITPGETSKDIPKSLYEREGRMNDYEEEIINEVANMQNVAFWTRNIQNRGFRINGFINHYPDFIIHTKTGKTIVLETKGDHLYAESKIRLGNLWASKAGNQFRYFMVYNTRRVIGAHTSSEFLPIIKEL